MGREIDNCRGTETLSIRELWWLGGDPVTMHRRERLVGKQGMAGFWRLFV
jgi:hypothetical protein